MWNILSFKTLQNIQICYFEFFSNCRFLKKVVCNIQLSCCYQISRCIQIFVFFPFTNVIFFSIKASSKCVEESTVWDFAENSILPKTYDYITEDVFFYMTRYLCFSSGFLYLLCINSTNVIVVSSNSKPPIMRKP